MPPLFFLAAMLLLTAGAMAAHLILRHRTAARFSALASSWKMQYSPTDRFGLTRQVITQFPVPGASDLLLQDLIYRQETDHYRYIFTVQYTEGVIRTKSRLKRAATLLEPRDRSEGWSKLVLAEHDCSLTKQYEQLMAAEGNSVSTKTA